MRRFILALSLVLFSPMIPSAAQEHPATNPQTTAPAQPAAHGGGTTGTTTNAPAPADASKHPDLKVTNLTLPTAPCKKEDDNDCKRKEEARQTQRKASLGDSILLTTSPDQLGPYLDYAAKENKTVTLFLDGNDTGIAPEAIDRQAGILRFHLERNADNKKIWSALLRDPFHHPQRKVKASVGLGGAVEHADNSLFTLEVVKWAWYAYLWLILMIALFMLFVWFARKRDILRDGPKPCPYSLGRSQMAWWFFLILFGYVMIWLISGDQDTITPSLLALMGISAGTALGSVLIDSTNGSAALSQAATDRLALQAAQQNAQQDVTTAQTAVAAAPANPVVQKQLADAQAALAVVNAKLLAVNNQINGVATVPQTRGFFRDILSDSNGTVVLHRFQIFVWTIVLGLIFLVSVVTELTMPAFSDTLLATMGISAGTYLGFKFPEK